MNVYITERTSTFAEELRKAGQDQAADYIEHIDTTRYHGLWYLRRFINTLAEFLQEHKGDEEHRKYNVELIKVIDPILIELQPWIKEIVNEVKSGHSSGTTSVSEETPRSDHQERSGCD